MIHVEINLSIPSPIQLRGRREFLAPSYNLRDR